MPTAGYTTTPTFGFWSEGQATGDQVALAISMPANGYITTIHCYAASFAGSNTMVLVIWKGGTDGSVLASGTASAASGTSPAWVTTTLAGNGLYVASGTALYVGWANPNDTASNSGFLAEYDSNASWDAKWNYVTEPVPKNVFTGATDHASSALGVYFDYTVVNNPAITSVSPTHGHQNDTVTLTGSGFTYTSSVTIGGNAASFTVVNDTTITATVPVTTNGSITITVTNPAGSASISYFVSGLHMFDGAFLQRVDLFAYDSAHLQLVTLEAFNTSLNEIS